MGVVRHVGYEALSERPFPDRRKSDIFAFARVETVVVAACLKGPRHARPTSFSTSELQREKFAEDKDDDGNRRYCERPSCQQGKPTARTFRLREASVDHEYGLSPTLGHERFRASPLRGRFSINEIDGGRGRVIVGDGSTHHVAGEVVNRNSNSAGSWHRSACGRRRAVLTRSNARPRLKCSIYSQSRPGSCDLSTLPHTPVDADDQRVARPPGGVRCSRATGAGTLVSRIPKPLSLPSRLPSCLAPSGQADYRTTCGAGSGYSF